MVDAHCFGAYIQQYMSGIFRDLHGMRKRKIVTRHNEANGFTIQIRGSQTSTGIWVLGLNKFFIDIAALHSFMVP